MFSVNEVLEVYHPLIEAHKFFLQKATNPSAVFNSLCMLNSEEKIREIYKNNKRKWSRNIRASVSGRQKARAFKACVGGGASAYSRPSPVSGVSWLGNHQEFPFWIDNKLVLTRRGSLVIWSRYIKGADNMMRIHHMTYWRNVFARTCSFVIGDVWICWNVNLKSVVTC